MITLSVERIRNGISELSVFGHAGIAKEAGDPVCAAVSVLVRTLILFAEKNPAIECEIFLPERGKAGLSVKKIPESEQKKWENICEFFLLGIRSVEQDFPNAVSLQYKV